MTFALIAGQESDFEGKAPHHGGILYPLILRIIHFSIVPAVKPRNLLLRLLKGISALAADR